LVLRVPTHRVDDARTLEGASLAVDGFVVEVGVAAARVLAPCADQFARHVVGDTNETEAQFTRRIAALLEARGISPRKLLCGRAGVVHLPAANLPTRSLLVGALTVPEARALQNEPLGEGRLLGCGLFVPHKGTAPVYEEREVP
ncbi:MAG: type I-MYXAN CRISPR-associated protein Cas6/Cmx6, partial [Gammaproteobacteria bacterium]